MTKKTSWLIYIYFLTSVIHVMTETGDQEAEAGEGAQVFPPAGVDQAAVHHLEHHHEYH